MAIGTPVSLGRTGALFGGNNAAWTVTTGSTVPAGGFILIAVAWYGAGITVTLSGGGLTWVFDKQQNGTVDTSRHVAAVSAQAPSGLASGTVITATPSGSAFNKMLAVAYTSGIATSSPVDGTAAGSTGTGTSWSTGSISTANAADLIWTVTFLDHLATNTSSGSTTELDDFQNTTDSVTTTTGYQIVSSTGSYSGTGTWSSVAGEWCAAVVAYKGTGGGGGVTVEQLATLGVG